MMLPQVRTNQLRAPRRGFSLIEILMAVFILSIGVISIAALLPAGIHQQKRAFDDVMGPVVANNAVALLRSRIGQADFASLEEFTPWSVSSGGNYATDGQFTVFGDWGWRRPTHIFENVPAVSGNDTFDERGSIDIFGFHQWLGSAVNMATEPDHALAPNLHGIPFRFDSSIDPANGAAMPPPRVFITREERWYPQGRPARVRESLGLPEEQSLYAWDCMFRRYQGRVQVAIFVYRVAVPGSGSVHGYQVMRNASQPTLPPLPIRISLIANGDDDGWDALVPAGSGQLGSDQTGTFQLPIFGTNPCVDYDATDAAQSWQESGQWLLDQNNNIHRVLTATCDETNPQSTPRRIELAAPVSPRMPSLVDYSVGNDGIHDVVTDLFYIPIFQQDPDSMREFRLDPIYVLVKEL